ncbi:hypothetical protein ASPBRDRAFT_28014 [Aspergillus brasiliensis CBS 101740]|uniref:Uncharacterized protein n=1 Tax=Aspergillus brasiliensis (strain CBS 101740 / IMI 381727 / IBT 21946) TaxID=767769 RepID=A0A1L9UTY6_ASPBC|nr:hypothetical protein ASPBRDRAFT_28014 [Aspergillus brasiliensis CBS 101740]
MPTRPSFQRQDPGYTSKLNSNELSDKNDMKNMREQKVQEKHTRLFEVLLGNDVDVAHGEKCGRAEVETSRSDPRKCFNNTNSQRSKNGKKEKDEQAVKGVRGKSVQRVLK